MGTVIRPTWRACSAAETWADPAARGRVLFRATRGRLTFSAWVPDRKIPVISLDPVAARELGNHVRRNSFRA
jgi:hypothetical protein